MGEYLGIVVLAILAGLICAVFVGGSWVLGPKKRTPYKLATYECGVEPVGDTRERFPIKFYLVAILFILFDLEIVLLWSGFASMQHQSVAFKQFFFVEFVTYMGSWLLGYWYVVGVGALDWDEATTLDPAKLGHKHHDKNSEKAA